MRRIALPQESLEALYGARDANLRHIEALLHVAIRTQGGELIVEGARADEQRVAHIFEQLTNVMREGYTFTNGDVKTAVQLLAEHADLDLRDYFQKDGARPAQPGARRRVNPKSVHQRKYLELIEQHDIVFGVGPAGTGKTYLAMAQAVSYLMAKKVSRIILARPAVEAGEKLGFLPGDLQEKVNPYLRPLYDALYDMMETEKATRLVERGTIEVAPIGFMRGRTLNDAFVILDEAQNTTSEQTKNAWAAKLRFAGSPSDARDAIMVFFVGNGWKIVEEDPLDSGGVLLLLENDEGGGTAAIVIDNDLIRPGHCLIVAGVYYSRWGSHPPHRL
jgi:phosphate starvation-inducible PhoH-like protein